MMMKNDTMKQEVFSTWGTTVFCRGSKKYYLYIEIVKRSADEVFR